MPQVSLSQKDLSKILSVCNQISPKKSDIEIFTFTKIELAKDQITVSAINNNTFFKSSLKSGSLESVEGEANFLIKSEVFANAVNLIADDMLSLEINLEKHTLDVLGFKSKHTLRINTDLLTDFIEPEEKFDTIQAKIKLKTEDFIEAVRASFVSVGQPKNVYEPKFLNVCFTVDKPNEMFLAVSTDRYRVTRTKVEAEIEDTNEKLSEEATNFLVLPKGLQFLIAALDNQEKLELNYLEDYLWVKFNESSLTLRYGEGIYPDYNKIIPQSFACNFKVLTKDVLEALKQVYLSARSNTINKSINLTVKPTAKKMILKSQTDDGYSSEAEIEILEYQGSLDDWSQSFNADYLIDYINTVKTEYLFWESNPGKPSVLSPENERERQIYLVSGLK